MSDTLCVRCEKKLENLMEGRGCQPDNGLAFLSYGHYGSTFFDPMDGSFLEIVICDPCLVEIEARLFKGKT